MPEQISFVQRRISNEPVKISATLFLDGVAGKPAAVGRGVVAVVVVDQVELGVVELRRPLERLRNVARRRDRAEGRVVVARADVAGGPENLADVFRDVAAVGFVMSQP